MSKETVRKKETAETVREGRIEGNTPAGEAASGKKEANKWPKMYVGPTVPGIGIQNRVYTEMPKEAGEKAEKVPEIKLLFIPVRSYPMANQMLRERKGYIYNAFCKMEDIRKRGSEV